MSERFQLGRPLYVIVALALLTIGLAATAARTIKQYQTPGQVFDHSRQGFCDFHNGIYFPSTSLLEGVSPYGNEYAETYPVDRQIPFYSPSILALHAPLALLPLRVSEVVYFIVSVGTMIGIAFLLVSADGTSKRIDVALLIAAGLIFSRAGHITLFDGYFTFELVLATFLAIHWGDRKPWLAALALVVVCSKPTYILPLGFLMLARGNVKAIVIGAVFSIIAAGVPVLWLAWNEADGDVGRGITVLIEQISETQEIHRSEQGELPVNTWTRIDLLAVIAKWTGANPAESMHLVVMALVLVPAMWVLHRRRERAMDDGLTGLTGAIILTAVLVSLYRQSYDALLIAAPLAGLMICGQSIWQERTRGGRVFLGVMMIAPLYSYFSSRLILGWLDVSPLGERLLTSISGINLAVLLVLFLWLGMSSKKPLQPA